MKSKRQRLYPLAALLLGVAAIAFTSVPAYAGVSTDNNPGGAQGGGGSHSIGGPTIACGDTQYVQSTFSLCNDTAGDLEASLNNGYTLCPSGFEVWRFYSESSAPGTVEGYTVSRAYQTMNCEDATGAFTSPDYADAAVGDVDNSAFISGTSPQFPSTSNNGTGVGGTVYASAVDSGDITTGPTSAQYGASCTSLESAGNTAAVAAVFTAMAKGTATTAQQTFANDYWADYQSGEGSGTKARNYLMNLPPGLASLNSPNWSLLAADYGASSTNSPCASAYQFIPPSTGLSQTNGVEGVCTMPVNTNTEEWEDVTRTLATGKTVTIFNQLSNTLGGDRFVEQKGSNSTVAGSGSVSSAFFNTWRADIGNQVQNSPLTTGYVGSPYKSTLSFDTLGSSADRSDASTVASTDADCIAFTSSIPAVNATPTTTTTAPKGGTTTTTKPSGTTTTTTPYVAPPNSGPSMTITPSAPVLAAGGALHPNQLTLTISPFSCNGAGTCNPNGIGPATLQSVTVTPEVTASGNYSDFWISGSPNDKPTETGPGEYSFVLPADSASGSTKTYTLDFAYPTTTSQNVTFKVTSASATYLIWEKVVVGQTCTNSKPSGHPTTTLRTCVPVYGNRQFVETFTPTIEPAVITKVVSGTVTPQGH